MKILKFVITIVSTISVVIAQNSCTSSDTQTHQSSNEIIVENDNKVTEEEFIFECNYFGEKLPDTVPKLFAPHIFKYTDYHSCLSFSANGKQVFFSRLKTSGEYVGVQTMKYKNGKWTESEFIQGTEKSFSPFISTDGERLFIAKENSLFVLYRENETWSNPQKLPDFINFQKRQDGLYEAASRSVYFTTMFGKTDGIFYSEFVNGEYQKPIKIKTGFDTNAGGYSYISPDESYMIFQSRARGGYGASDLYIMFNKNGSWTKAINMGSKINTRYSESFPYVTPDGKYLFFNSNRPSELNSKVPEHFYGNFYWVSTEIFKQFETTLNP